MDKSPEAFRTISEVAEALETPAHVLRFWETRFPQIRPVKRAGGRRYYRPSDVALLSGIKRLLHEDGMTIRGVQKILREQGIRHVSGLIHDEPSAEEQALGAAMLDLGIEEAEEIAPQDAAEETVVALRAALAPAVVEPEAEEAAAGLDSDGVEPEHAESAVDPDAAEAIFASAEIGAEEDPAEAFDPAEGPDPAVPEVDPATAEFDPDWVEPKRSESLIDADAAEAIFDSAETGAEEEASTEAGPDPAEGRSAATAEDAPDARIEPAEAPVATPEQLAQADLFAQAPDQGTTAEERAEILPSSIDDAADPASSDTPLSPQDDQDTGLEDADPWSSTPDLEAAATEAATEDLADVIRAALADPEPRETAEVHNLFAPEDGAEQQAGDPDPAPSAEAEAAEDDRNQGDRADDSWLPPEDMATAAAAVPVDANLSGLDAADEEAAGEIDGPLSAAPDLTTPGIAPEAAQTEAAEEEPELTLAGWPLEAEPEDQDPATASQVLAFPNSPDPAETEDTTRATLAARLRALPRGSLAQRQPELLAIAARIAALRERLSGPARPR